MLENESKFKLRSFSKLGILIAMFAFIFTCWTYFQTETLTYTSNIDGQALCGDAGFRYYKIVNYDGIVGKAELICVREKTDESTFLKVNLVKTDYGRKQNWEIIYTQKMYQDGGLNWPIYI